VDITAAWFIGENFRNTLLKSILFTGTWKELANVIFFMALQVQSSSPESGLNVPCRRKGGGVKWIYIFLTQTAINVLWQQSTRLLKKMKTKAITYQKVRYLAFIVCPLLYLFIPNEAGGRCSGHLEWRCRTVSSRTPSPVRSIWPCNRYKTSIGKPSRIAM